MEAQEGKPLLHNNAVEHHKPTGLIRYFVSISVILVVFKGAEEMCLVTSKQFVYSWCQRQEASRNTTVTPTATPTTAVGVTGSTGAPGACGGSAAAEDAAQEAASRWELYLNLANAGLLFFSITAYGLLSDYVGRKRFLCLAVAGYTARCAITAAVVHYDLHVAYLLLAYSVDGLMGSAYAVSLCCYIMAADVTANAKHRALAIVFIECLIGTGKTTTQFANGYFIHSSGFFYPIFTAAIGCLAALIITIVLLRDTLPARPIESQEHIQYQGTRTINMCVTIPPCGKLLRDFVGFYVSSKQIHDRRLFLLCLATLVLYILPIMGRSDPLVLLQLGSPFCWGSEYIGWYNSLYITFSYICALLVFKLLQRCMSDSTIACMGLVSAAMYFLDTGLANSDMLMFAGTAMGLLMTLPRSVLRAIMSKMAGKHKQGAVFAGIVSCELLCKLVSNPASLALYSGTVTTARGLLFLVQAGFNGLALVTMLYVHMSAGPHDPANYNAIRPR